MSGIVNLSEAASLGLHASMLLAAASERWWAARDLAARLQVSEAHLAKVLQRLARGGLLLSTRGPHGGFRLGAPASEITLLEIYEAIEGPLASRGCLLRQQVCQGRCCLLGQLAEDLTQAVRNHLAQTTLAQAGSQVDVQGGNPRLAARPALHPVSA